MPPGLTSLRSLVHERLGVIVTAIAAVPFVVGAVVMVTRYRDFAPFADIALIELGTRDVGRHLVLLGVYSRFGWRHPGPVLFYVLAIPYWLTGGSSGGLYAGAALLNGACVVAIGWLAHRRGGRQLLLLALLFVLLMTRALTPEVWADPWNPSLALYPLVVFLFAAWSFGEGDDLALPIAVLTGSFCVQTHVGYALFVVVPAAVAIVSRVLVARSSTPADAAGDRGRTSLRRMVLWSAGLAFVLWLPPLIDQVIHHPGNLQDLVSFFRAATSEYGVKDGLSFTRFELGPQPAWLFGELQAGWLGLVDYSNPPVPVGGVLLVAALVVAGVRRDWSGVRLGCFATALLAMSVFAVSRVTEGLFPYVVRWSPAVGLITWLAIVWIGWRAIRDHLSANVVKGVGALVAAALVVASAVNIAAAVTTAPHDEDKSELVKALTNDVTPKLDKSRPVAVETPDPTGGVESLWMLPALALQLERQGFDVRVTDDRFAHRGVQGDEHQIVSIHHIAPDAPTVPSLASTPPAGQRGDMVVWVTNT